MTTNGTVVRCLAAGIALVLVSGGARADGMQKAPVYKADTYTAPSWAGTYFGLHVGYAWADVDTDAFLVNGDRAGHVTRDEDGGFFGFNLGYNVLVGANFLVGVEGDFSLGVINGDAVACTPAVGCARAEGETNYVGTVRGRVGYVGGNWLIYATGGVAFKHTDNHRFITASQAAPALVGRLDTDSDTDTGWVVGGGVEWGFAPNWSMRLEYQRLQFDDVDRRFDYFGFPGATRLTESEVAIDTVRIGLTYRIGGAGVGWMR